jgi:hypothetical protein
VVFEEVFEDVFEDDEAVALRVFQVELSQIVIGGSKIVK